MYPDGSVASSAPCGVSVRQLDMERQPLVRFRLTTPDERSALRSWLLRIESDQEQHELTHFRRGGTQAEIHTHIHLA